MIPISVPENYRYYEYKGAKDMFSLYAQELYRFRPDLIGMFSVQYAYNRYRLYDEKYLQSDFAAPYHFFNPRIGINHNIDENWNSYVSLAYTSREPRLKNLYDAAEASTPESWGPVKPQFSIRSDGSYDFRSPLVKPERLFDLELGAGFSSEDIRGSVNLFWMEFSDEIVDKGQVDRFGQSVTGNAEKTRHYGVELSGTAKVLQSVTVSANITLSSNRFVRHTDFSTGLPVDFKGNAIAGAPAILANARISYSYENLSLSLSGRFVGKQYADNLNTESQVVDPFFVSDASASYKFDNVVSNIGVEAKIQVNNIFDTLYAAFGNKRDASTFQYFVGAERNAFFNVAITL
jgi:iron complex outermembrane receptor protein